MAPIDSPGKGKTGWIGITLGDPAGVGPEVTLKALASLKEPSAGFVLIGDPGVAKRTARVLNLPSAWPGFDPEEPSSPGQIRMHPAGAPLAEEIAPGSKTAAESALAALESAAQLALAGKIDAVVTAPVNKEAIIRTGKKFTGQTEMLSDLAGASRTAMMLLGEDDRGRWLRVALATTHLPLRQVADKLTRAKIVQAIGLAAQACRLLELPSARIGVCGLNPHAGEGGQMGDEEITIVGPAVEEARQKGFDARGPFAADTLFYYAYKGEYEAVVAMYHDQGLAPLKMIGFDRGINWTLGLPFIRTSPDHGTAYDIAGKGVASPSSMLSAINLAVRLANSNYRW